MRGAGVRVIMPWTGGSNEDVTATASASAGASGSGVGLGGGGAVQVGGGLWNDGVFGVQNQLGPSGPSQDGVGQVLGGVSPNTVDKHMRDGVSLSDLCKFFFVAVNVLILTTVRCARC